MKIITGEHQEESSEAVIDTISTAKKQLNLQNNKSPRVPHKRTYPDWNPRDGHYLMAVIDCPYCGKEHIHGAAEGHRVAHCAKVPQEIKGPGYFIFDPKVLCHD